MNNLKILLLSDGTGKTGKSILDSILSQYQNLNETLELKNNIRSIEELDKILLEASIHHDIIPFTFVDPKLRNHMLKNAATLNHVDLLGPLIQQFSSVLNQEPNYIPGLLHNKLDDKYFHKVRAIEFALKNDESISTESLNEADLILIGISGTSKSPLSVFLSTEGFKVVNITLSKDLDLNTVLKDIDQRKILGLTIKADNLADIRKNRMVTKDVYSENYSEISNVREELEFSSQVFKANPLWPIFDITDKSLDQIVIEMTNVINQRKISASKQVNRFS